MDILVTGGSGFVGRWLQETQPDGMSVRYLNKKDYENGHWEWYDWDAVIHCANVSPLRVIQNHKGKLLYISSGAVYDGVSEYAANKRKWEAMCPNGSVIARLFTFIGEGLKNEYAITKFVEAAKQGNPIEVWGDGTAVRSYLHGFDLGTWLWKLLEDVGRYDVGSDIPYNMLSIAGMVADVYGIKSIHILNDGYPQSTYLPDTTRAKELGCEETIGLRESIERTKHEGI